MIRKIMARPRVSFLSFDSCPLARARIAAVVARRRSRVALFARADDAVTTGRAVVGHLVAGPGGTGVARRNAGARAVASVHAGAEQGVVAGGRRGCEADVRGFITGVVARVARGARIACAIARSGTVAGVHAAAVQAVVAGRGRGCEAPPPPAPDRWER